MLVMADVVVPWWCLVGPIRIALSHGAICEDQDPRCGSEGGGYQQRERIHIPPWEVGKIMDSKCHFWGDVLVSWRLFPDISYRKENE